MNTGESTRGRGPIMAKNRPHDPGKKRSPKTPVYSGVNDEFLKILFKVIHDPITLHEGKEQRRLQNVIEYGTHKEHDDIDDIMVMLVRSKDRYQISINDLNHTAHCIKDSKDSRTVGHHRLLSSDPSKLIVEPGTLKHKWMIQFGIAKSTEKEMLTVWNKLTSTIDDIEDRRLLKLSYVKCDSKQHTMVLDHIEWEEVETNSICFMPEFHAISFMVPATMICRIFETRLKVGEILQVSHAICDSLKMETTMEMKIDKVSYVLQVISNIPTWQKKWEWDIIPYSKSSFTPYPNQEDRIWKRKIQSETIKTSNSYFKKKERRSYKRKKRYKKKKKNANCNEDFQNNLLSYGRNSTQQQERMVLSVMALMRVIGSRVKPKEDAIIMHNAPHWN